ncbi:MAG: hypothetical protein RJA17_1456 [Pseudomonadota bacterium]
MIKPTSHGVRWSVQHTLKLSPTHALVLSALAAQVALAQAPARESTTASTTPAASALPQNAGAESRLREVTVVDEAVSADDERRDSSTTKIIFDRSQIEKIDAVTVSDLLRALPGVNLSLPPVDGRRGRGHSGPSDRLMPRIVVDGEPLGGGPGGTMATLRLPTELIERIEIIRNSTAEFPSGPGGTVNLILRDVPPEKTTTTKWSASHDGSAFGGRANVVYGNREGVAGTILTLSVDGSPQTLRRSSAEQSGAGSTTERDEQSGHNLGLHFISRFTQDLGRGEQLIISPMFFGSERQVDTQTTLTGGTISRETDTDRVRRGSLRVSGEWKKRTAGAGEASVRGTVHVDETQARGRLIRFDNAGGVDSDSATRNQDSGRGFGLAAKRSLPLANDHLGTFGFNARYRAEDERRSQQISGATSVDSSERNLALWGQDEWQLNKSHTLTPGLRLETSENRTKNATTQETKTSATNVLPSLHWLWRLNQGANLRASLAQTQRQPSISQISSVITEATGDNGLANPDRSGNPNLKAEKTTTLQLGLERFLENKRGSGGANLYVRNTSNKILSRTTLEGIRYLERPVNAASARDYSLVFDFKLKPKAIQRLELQGNASANRLEITDRSGEFVRQESARYAASLGGEYKLENQKTSLGGNVSWNSSFSREASTNTIVNVGNNHQIDLYALHRLDATSNLRLSVSNLTAPNRTTISERYAAGALDTRESSTTEGVRMLMLTIEKKW